jgi:IclR family KDG regulon transcriptional repressor
MVRSIQRAFQCLEALSGNEKSSMSIVEVARATDLDKATVSRIMKTLAELGYVEYVRSQRAYRLTPKMFCIGSRTVDAQRASERTRGLMRELAAEFGETVNLGVLNGHQVVYVEKIESTFSVRADLSVGKSIPLWCTGLGKAILSWRPDLVDEIAAEIRPITSHTIGTVEELRRELEEVRSRGYAIDYEEYVPGMVCVAVPLVDPTGRVEAAMSVAGLIMRLDEESAHAIGRRMVSMTEGQDFP